jgi:hypothetical protein
MKAVEPKQIGCFDQLAGKFTVLDERQAEKICRFGIGLKFGLPSFPY